MPNDPIRTKHSPHDAGFVRDRMIRLGYIRRYCARLGVVGRTRKTPILIGETGFMRDSI